MLDRSFVDWLSLADAAGLLPLAPGPQGSRFEALPLGHDRVPRDCPRNMLQIGGTRCTSTESLQRFFEGLSASKGGAVVPKPANPSNEPKLAVFASRKPLREPWRTRVPKNLISSVSNENTSTATSCSCRAAVEDRWRGAVGVVHD